MAPQLFGLPTNGKPVPPPIQDAITQGINDWATVHDSMVSSAWRKGDADTLAAAQSYTDEASKKGGLTPGAALGSTNLDTVTTAGYYQQPASGTATPANGYPAGEYRGELVVWAHAGSSNITQMYIGSFTGRMWQRERYSNTWTPWVMSNTGGNIFSGGALLGAEKLDTITGTSFRQQAATDSATVANGYPEGAGRGILMSMSWSGHSTYHLYMSPAVGKTWMRERYNNVWGSWMLVSGAPTATAASPLPQQDRTIQVTGDYRPDAWAASDGTVLYWTGPSGVERIGWGYRGDGYVGKIGAAAGYTTMQIRKVQSNNEIEVSCLNPTTGRHVTYRVQGEGPLAGQDDQRRIEETWVGTYSGTTVSKDLLIMPRSNIEWAFQIDVGGNKQFVPYHGSASGTANRYEPATITDGNGKQLAISGLPVDGVISNVNGLKIRQRLYVTHPDSGSTRWAAIDEMWTIAPDGMLQSEAVITFLKDTKVGSNYAAMTPVAQDVFDKMQVMGGGAYTIKTTPPDATEYLTVTEGHTTQSALFTSTANTKAFVAVNYLDRAASFMVGNSAEDKTATALRIEQRSSGLTKLYPQPFTEGTVVPAGTVWRPGAQWRYGEIANAAQFI